MGHRFDPKHVSKLLNSDRYALLQPTKLFETLELQKNDSLADIGCGPGFLTVPAAEYTSGIVYGIDVEPKMLEFLSERANQNGLANIRLVNSDAEKIDLPDSSVDKAICAFVLHEVGDLYVSIREAKRILKPEGKFLILEWEKKQTESGPPVSERLDASDISFILQQEGFQTKVEKPNQDHYLILASE